MSQHIETLIHELLTLRAHCPQLTDRMSFDTRAHLQSRTQGQVPNNSVAVVLFELLDDLEKLARKSTRSLD